SIEILLKPLITHVRADRLQSALVEFRPELLRRHSCGARGLHLRDPIALCDIERFHRVLHEGTPKAPELESQLFLQWFLFGGRDCINCEHGDECDYDAWVHWEGGECLGNRPGWGCCKGRRMKTGRIATLNHLPPDTSRFPLFRKNPSSRGSRS